MGDLMAKSVEKETAGLASGGLEAVARAAGRAGGRGPAPVHLWNPPFCGDIGLKITRDGVWHYRNSPIQRPALVRLFASILRRDPEGHMLVTPVEKVAVAVEDAPFLAVEMASAGAGDARRLSFRTNLDEWVDVDAEHPLRFESGPSGGVKPYVRVRGDLWALATRALLMDLAQLAQTRDVDGASMFGVAAGGGFFVICPASEIEEIA